MGPAELAQYLDRHLEERLSSGRALHSRRAAALAAELCRRNGLDPERGRAAGLAHDLCKELPMGEQLELARFFAASELGFELAPSLLGDKIVHGPAAAGLLVREFGVGDRELLEAVARHTVGKAGMSTLCILLYVADKIEPGRERVDEVFKVSCLDMPPETLLRIVLGSTIAWLQSRGRVVAPETLLLYNSLRPSERE